MRLAKNKKKKRIKIVMTKQMKINEPTNAEASDERGLGHESESRVCVLGIFLVDKRAASAAGHKA